MQSCDRFLDGRGRLTCWICPPTTHSGPSGPAPPSGSRSSASPGGGCRRATRTTGPRTSGRQGPRPSRGPGRTASTRSPGPASVPRRSPSGTGSFRRHRARHRSGSRPYPVTPSADRPPGFSPVTARPPPTPPRLRGALGPSRPSWARRPVRDARPARATAPGGGLRTWTGGRDGHRRSRRSRADHRPRPAGDRGQRTGSARRLPTGPSAPVPASRRSPRRVARPERGHRINRPDAPRPPSERQAT